MSFKRIAAALALMSMVGAANAQFQARDFDNNGSIDGWYDVQHDLTWLADQNYALTSGWWFDNTWEGQLWGNRDPSLVGRMDWSEAHTFVEQLNFAGTTGWRLPTILAEPTPNFPALELRGYPPGYVQTCADISAGAGDGGLCIGGANEMTALAGNEGLFLNLRTDGIFSVDATWRSRTGWTFFGYSSGFASASTWFNEQGGVPVYAMVVRDGDVAPIPEPSTYALMLAGLAAVGFAAKRRRAK